MNKETAIIEKLVPGGQALATLADGKKAFIWGAMPGETVEFELTKNKKTYCEGVAIRIITNPSEHRVAPKDDCYLSTSPWQIMDFNYELQQKSELTRECFRQNHLNLDVLPTITDGKDYFYRNKMEYSLYWDHDTAKIHLAFHKRGSHGKQPIAQSSIERPEIFVRASQIVDQLNAKHAEARTYQSLLLRCNQQGKVSGDLFVNGQPHPIMTNLSDELLGQNFTYSPNGFFQINLPVYELALQAIAKEIHTEKVLDLHPGIIFPAVCSNTLHTKIVIVVLVRCLQRHECSDNLVVHLLLRMAYHHRIQRASPVTHQRVSILGRQGDRCRHARQN